MSHEIRTPMNAIVGFTDLLDKPDLSAAKRKSFVDIVQSSAHQLLAIVTDILTISSIDTQQEKVNLQAVCVNSIILNLISIFKSQAVNQNVSIYAKQPLTDEQSEIQTDRTKITQILTNLITNALKFTHQGFVEFGYELLETEIPLLQFYVKDSGIGIKNDMQEKIFERFRQADDDISKRYGGTGLGLAICKAFVELLGGKIWVQSVAGEGSTFYFTIPYHPIHQTDPSVIIEPIEHTTTILVVEDEEFNFLLIEELLSGSGVEIIHAKNGREAVDFCENNKHIALVLMDIKLPVMDGYTAARLIKEFRPHLPIIAQSAYALEQEIEVYSDIFDDYLTKPLNTDDLRQTVSKYVNL